MDVCDYFGLHATTMHGAIAYLDRLQPNEKFSRFEWQMLAICCILISSKYNECEEHVPDFATLEDITKQSISNETVLSYEFWALKRMQWKLNVRTPIAFLSAFRCRGLLFKGDIKVKGAGDMSSETVDIMSKEGKDLEAVLFQTISALASLCILDIRFKRFKSSIIAAAIVKLARAQLHLVPWHKEMDGLTSHKEHELDEVMVLLQASSAYLLSREGQGQGQGQKSDLSEMDDESHADGDLATLGAGTGAGAEELSPTKGIATPVQTPTMTEKSVGHRSHVSPTSAVDGAVEGEGEEDRELGSRQALSPESSFSDLEYSDDFGKGKGHGRMPGRAAGFERYGYDDCEASR